MAVAPPFAGFSRDAIQFLADLAVNNERSWFQPRKGDYERLLKEPLEALCLALADRFESRGLPPRSDPSRHTSRCPSRAARSSELRSESVDAQSTVDHSDALEVDCGS